MLFLALSCLGLSHCKTPYQFGGLKLENAKGFKVYGDYKVDDDVPRMSEKTVCVHFNVSPQWELASEEIKVTTSATNMMDRKYLGKSTVVLTLKNPDGATVFCRSYHLAEDGRILSK